ncbi:response regulator receiver protein [Moesziomyces antarcticus]|uniref:Response regulator receiver protein n=2 Tax=Pseudozyma antarctica TaxID=84753 RepID=A0A081CIS4_PSEA2|nr:response regulator receiver protein [Moesziomyces antarcticus]GAK66570.1 response regulator receiver protein [Moesziomyces antarcticus]SPO47617.1 uncharacterized protein PSANT_05305 [Moesziomyces antarcticus]
MSLAASASANAATLPAAAATVTGPSSPLPPTNSLRILLVDDNHINLSVLSTLLKRRFGHALAKPPVSLDSGLKALQMLRTQIFDLILMDIEMPYLNGVECTRRIRAGEDGILAANRGAHIVAVTTNVGPEPAALYRHTGMDGMISKPVRFQNFQQYLCPLSIEASEAKGSVTPVLIGSEEVMPPLPPIDLEHRLFFVPTDNGGTVTTSRHGIDRVEPSAEYSDANGFAAMLKAQTSKSLRDRKALSVSRSSTLSEPRRSSFNSPRSEHLPTIRPVQQSTSADLAHLVADEDNDGLYHEPQPAKSTDAEQTPHLSFQSLIERETRDRERDHTIERRAPLPIRPTPVHRISSPAYLLDASPIARVRADPAMRSDPDLVPHPARRPDIRPWPPKRLRRDDASDESWSGTADSALDSASGGNTTSSSSAWSSTPKFSEDGATSRQLGAFDALGSLSHQCGSSPSSGVTTPSSSPADMGLRDDYSRDAKDDDLAGAVFSPCADDLLSPRSRELGFVPPLLPLSTKAASIQNSPRILVRTGSDKAQLGLRMDELHLGSV